MDTGLRGFSVGGAQVSEKHCGFVINKGGATAKDVQLLIKEVADRVEEQFRRPSGAGSEDVGRIRMKFVIVTGMSGAGKSTALKMLEDMGYFCVDNLPIALLREVCGAGSCARKRDQSRWLLGVDIRSGQFPG